jgi:hypothetical protein
MRYHKFFLISILFAGVLAMAKPAPAYEINSAFDLERQIIHGRVLYVDDQVACVRTDYGNQIYVQLGPQWYWERHRYWLPAGDDVEMAVWYDPNDQYTDWYFAADIWGPGYHFALTNDVGVPLWVIYADDYYYGLGYRASCVSYMFWFDCMPTYFLHLILPPPPPMAYRCYYGPHWREHHRDWHHGPRFGRDGSYWHDGQGYDPPSRRPGGRSHDEVRPGGGNVIAQPGSEGTIGTPATVTNPRTEIPPAKPPLIRKQEDPKKMNPPDTEKSNATKQKKDKEWNQPPKSDDQRKDSGRKQNSPQLQDQLKLNSEPKSDSTPSKIFRLITGDNGKQKDQDKSDVKKSDKNPLAPLISRKQK